MPQNDRFSGKMDTKSIPIELQILWDVYGLMADLQQNFQPDSWGIDTDFLILVPENGHFGGILDKDPKWAFLDIKMSKFGVYTSGIRLKMLWEVRH